MHMQAIPGLWRGWPAGRRWVLLCTRLAGVVAPGVLREGGKSVSASRDHFDQRAPSVLARLTLAHGLG